MDSTKVFTNIDIGRHLSSFMNFDDLNNLKQLNKSYYNGITQEIQKRKFNKNIEYITIEEYLEHYTDVNNYIMNKNYNENDYILMVKKLLSLSKQIREEYQLMYININIDLTFVIFSLTCDMLHKTKYLHRFKKFFKSLQIKIDDIKNDIEKIKKIKIIDNMLYVDNKIKCFEKKVKNLQQYFK
jgi:hypothetical protein